MKKKPTLLVISHTEHFQLEDGTIVGWPSTVRELDELIPIFERIIHVACFYKGAAPSGMTPYRSSAIKFVRIPPFGGSGIEKFSILLTAPLIVWRVFYWLRVVTHFQFRAPTSMGVYLLPLLTVFTRKPGWFKYAGNWNQENPPLSYAWQRFWLKKIQRRKVTLNGSWYGQPNHCLSFANPCLSDEDRALGARTMASKSFYPPYTLCFIGRIEKAKGVDRIIDSILEKQNQQNIECIHFIGDSPELEQYVAKVKDMPCKVHFHGFQNHQFIYEILKGSHFLLLPSDSEGFPKVVAEGANFGCIPIVSSISSIPFFFSELNAYLWKTDSSFSVLLNRALNDDTDLLKRKANSAYQVAAQFTFEVYRQQIIKRILNVVN